MFNQTMYVVTEGDPPGDVLVSVTLIATRECEDEYTVNVIASDGTALGEFSMFTTHCDKM